MSITSEITRIKNNIASAYSKISEKGGTLPETQDSANLADTIDTITGGSSSDYNVKINTTFTNNNRQLIGHIIEVKELDTSNLTNATGIFSNCTSLKNVPLFDISHATNCSYLFSSCTSLERIPALDFSSCTNMASAFLSCTKLAEIPQFNTSSVTNMSRLFSYCSALTTVPILNTSKVTDFSYCFSDCSNLSNNSLYNILEMCIGATSYTGTKTLLQLGLSSTQATTCTTLSNWADAQSAGWTTGY